jgi:UDP-N-acetylglucosamine 1-carboxyvinyltransferase
VGDGIQDTLIIRGRHRLDGEVAVGGSKNSALSLLSAVVLAEGKTTLRNVPDISDTHQKADLLRGFGVDVAWSGDSLEVDTTHLRPGKVNESLARSIRTSFFLLGPLVARLGRVSLPSPGGCQIGARPVDFHLKGLAQLGCRIDFVNGVYHAECDQLIGTDLYLDKPSPGATQHLMTAAALAQGVTTISNAAMEPEVTSLIGFLEAMGARIEGVGTPTLTIYGQSRLHATTFRVPSDRMQAGTYLVAGAITGGRVRVTGVMPDDQLPVTQKLRDTGCVVTEGHEWIEVQGPDRPRATTVTTLPFPGFPTDLQQPMCSLLSLAHGTSVIEETVYENRIGHIRELNRMGANIELTAGNTAIVHGVPRLTGANVEATDLRAGAALVLAGLAAEGTTHVQNLHFIDRGYEKLEATLRALGADISRSSESRSANGAPRL